MATTRRRAQRSTASKLGERAIEVLIHVCGVSAIAFIFAIFLFVAKEALQIPAPAWPGLALVGAGLVAIAGAIRDTSWLLDHPRTNGIVTRVGRPGARLLYGLLGGALLLGGFGVLSTGSWAGFVEMVGRVPGMFSSIDWGPTDHPPSWGIVGLLVGTAWCVGLSLMISVPIGIAAAVYLSEFASVRVRESLKVVVELLAAIPSVVWGFVGVMVLNPILQAMGAQIGLNGLNGALLLALMTLPLLVSLGEDALRAVPDSYRQAATAMGATRWEMVTRVLLPAARPGLLVAVLLGVGRCVGETMAVLMATGHQVNIPTSLYDPVRTLTATIAAELGEAVRGGDHYRTLFMLGLLLFAITFVVNVTADVVIRGRHRR